MPELSLTHKLQIALAKEKMNQSELADKLGYLKSSVSSMMARDTWKVNELIKYANAIGYDVEITLVNPITGDRI